MLYTLLLAEEHGVIQANAEARIHSFGGSTAQLLSGQNTELTRALGAQDDWAIRVLRAVGNYGELHERNLGSASPLKIERGLNRLWSDGRLMYAPPLD